MAPLALVGIALISGLVGGGAYGDRPIAGTLFSLGTAVAYGLFLLTMRTINRDLRGAATPLFWATASCAACSLVGRLALGEMSWPDGEGHAWLILLGLSAQVVGYFAIGTALPRLPAVIGSRATSIDTWPARATWVIERAPDAAAGRGPKLPLRVNLEVVEPEHGNPGGIRMVAAIDGDGGRLDISEVVLRLKTRRFEDGHWRDTGHFAMRTTGGSR